MEAGLLVCLSRLSGMGTMSAGMQWSRLIERAGLTDRMPFGPDPLITSIEEDSRKVGPGCCFVATRGIQADGHAYIDAAIAAGASAVVCEIPVAAPEEVATLTLRATRGAASRLAAALYDLDTRMRDGRLNVVGVTGTNGKSTFCYLMRSILRRAGYPTALLGTIQYDLVGRRLDASMTTPPATTFMRHLAEAADAGASHAVAEVSSHALDQGRCDGVRFAVGVYTNLTGDHLDYHVDMDRYLQAKKRLFDGLDANAVAVVNREDDHAERIVADCPGRIVRYGIAEEQAVFAHEVEVAGGINHASAMGTRFTVWYRDARDAVYEHGIDWPLIGRHNVLNGLAAFAAAAALGVHPAQIAEGLSNADRVPGRLERVRPDPAKGDTDHLADFAVLVDYAHTDDALRNVLSALRPLADEAGGRLIVMFGCGGDRDRTKRPRMAQVAARFADEIVVTSDNPRSEDPIRIIEDIRAGFGAAVRESVTVEPDRRRAIARCIARARPGDIILLAGKGHETYQIIGNERMSFDDVQVAGEILAERSGASA